MSATDDKFKPVQPHEVSDIGTLPGEFRAFRSEMRDSLESIARTLQKLERIEARLDVMIDRQNDMERRLVALETKKAKRRK